MADDVWLTAAQVAKMIGRTRSTVFRISRDRLPYDVTGGGDKGSGHRRYRLADVTAYLKRDEPAGLAERVTALEERVTRLEER